MTMNLKKRAEDSTGAKIDNPIRSDYHAPQDQAPMKDADLDPMSRRPLYGVGNVSLLVGADATVVVHKEDGLV
ncbi:hypothetical protein GW17_00047330 [Ensete ventricosum]|nr:hypothetical protein GW17_00047330 [Ensete ventricosum]